jgi:pimeloyl-ACP methyl ester carboxylesterase
MAQAGEDGWVTVPQVAALRETVYGIKTHYVTAGRGEPVVIIHGGGPGSGGAAGFGHTIPALARKYKVFAIDLIGAGLTDKPLIEYSFQTLVNHVAGFIDALNLGQVRIMGNSQGAYVAMKYALDNPGRIRSVALISSGTLAKAMGLSDDGKAAPLPRFDGTKESLKAFMSLIVNDPKVLTDELIESRFKAASLPGHKEMLASLEAYRQLMQKDPTHRQVYDVKDRLPKFNLPWCMIWGGADRTAPLDPLGNRMHALFPDVPFYAVEGAGHQVQNDKPEECNRILLEFFEQH